MGETQLLAISSSWQLFLALLIPLLLIGWQYSFRVVFGYVLVTTLADLAILYGNGLMGTMRLEIGGITFSRTVIFLFTGFIVTQLMGAQRAQRRKLAEANLQLLHHAATSEQLAVSRERNRLARELHDTLAHTLSALSVQLEAVDSAWDHTPERARNLLHKSLASTRSGLTETRRALQALRASPLEDLGLTHALRSLAESSAARVGAQLDLQLPEDVGNVAPDVEQTIYRIAQEALSNLSKHSQATEVALSLVRYDNHLLLDIRDNGRGFDPAQVEIPGHYGLSGMRERAELVGGALEIKSAPGKGACVRLAVST
jgi:signal transduction histidine kinase